MSNDVVIRVRVKQDARDGFAAVGQEAEVQGQKSGEKFTTRFGSVMSQMGQRLADPVKRAGSYIGEQMGEHSGKSFVTRLSTVVTSQVSKLTEIGRTIGRSTGTSISTEITESVVKGYRDADGRLRDERGRTVSGGRSTGTTNNSTTNRTRGGSGGRGGEGGRGGDADVDKQSLLARALGWGRDAAGGFATSFLSNISGILSPTNILAAIGIAGLAGLIAVPLSGAIASAVLLALGGGAIALGVVAAFKDPRIQRAGEATKERFGKLFESFGKFFRGPVENFLVGKDGKGGLNDFLTKMIPNFEHLGAVLGPVADKLGNGIIGMLQNMMPGLIDGIEGAAPIIEVLADRLPDIGQALGDFFREMGEHGDDAAVFFNDLITFLVKVIGFVGRLIGFFVGLYAGIRRFVTDAKTLILEFVGIVITWFGKVLNAATLAFGWIPGLGGKLRTAQAEFAGARKGINAELAKIKDKTVTIRVRTLGMAAANAALGVAAKLHDLGYAAGGVVGQLPSIGQAASGGIRGGMTWVGERGPELANLAPGSRVWSNGDSQRMAGGGGGDMVAVAQYVPSGNDMVDAIMKNIQIRVTRRYSGSVQAAMGRG